MAIQFSCPGCQQPIEIDDEWGGQHVGCPFCERVVTAPMTSTFTSDTIEAPQVARQVVGTAPPSPAPEATNDRLHCMAMYGLVFGMIAVFFFVAYAIIAAGIVQFLGPDVAPLQMYHELQEKMSTDPRIMNRIFLACGVVFLCFCFWVTGLVLSLIAVRRKGGRGQLLAKVGIACSTILPLIFCSSFVIGLIQG